MLFEIAAFRVREGIKGDVLNVRQAWNRLKENAEQ
jgi:hypothetical protein